MLDEQTNNRLESLNSKIKRVCTGFASLDTFFSDFFTVLQVLRSERAHNTIISRISKLTLGSTATTEDRFYEGFLTAHGHVLAEIVKFKTLQFPDVGALVPSPEGPLSVADHSCTCELRCSFRSPFRP